jgi:hypothetical protein
VTLFSPNAARCSSTSRRSGERCKNPAVTGSDPARCRFHLFRKVSDVKAELEVAARQREAVAVLQAHGAQPVEDPVGELLQLGGDFQARTQAAARILERLCTDSAPAEMTQAAERAHERWADRYARLLTDLARLGIEERHVRVREADARRIVAAVDGALAEADLSEDQRAAVRSLIVDHLRRAS